MAKNIDKELLISMVEARPALWDKQSGDFKDKHLKIDCWKAVCLSLNEDFDILEEKQRQEYGKLNEVFFIIIIYFNEKVQKLE